MSIERFPVCYIMLFIIIFIIADAIVVFVGLFVACLAPELLMQNMLICLIRLEITCVAFFHRACMFRAMLQTNHLGGSVGVFI